MPVRLLISDANVLIDIHVGGLLDVMFNLPFEYATPETLFEQELSSTLSDLIDCGLQLAELTDEMLIKVQELSQQHNGVSSHDLEAMVLADDRKVPLLTGDKKLRQVCLLENIDVRGTIWLVGEMLEANMITVDKASEAYRRMEEDGSRLPWDEVDRQLKQFRKKQ